MKTLNKLLEKYILLIVTIGFIWVVIGPWLLTQKYFTVIDFTDGTGESQRVGNTIGGITAPILGLITILLLYLTIVRQNYEPNFRIISNVINDFKKSILDFEHDKNKGELAIQNFPFSIWTNYNAGIDYDFYKKLDEFENFITKFNNVFTLQQGLITSNDYEKVINKEVEHIYTKYFQYALSSINKEWKVTETDTSDLIKGKMYSIKIGLDGIGRKISEFSDTK